MDGPSFAIHALPLLYSTDVGSLGEAASSPFVANLLPIALAAAAIIIILYYLLGKALGSPQIEAFAKEELSQFIITILLVASWFAIYALISETLSLAACGDSSCSLFSLAFYSLDVLLYQTMSAYIGFLSIEVFVGVISSVGFSLPMGAPVMGVKWMSFHPFGGMSMLSNAIVSVIESIGILVGLVVGRQQLLTFFQDIVPAFLLPVGLFLRALPFTRVTGSSLIAISFAVFLIFPASIVLSHYMIFGAYEPVIIPTVPTPNGLCVDLANPDDAQAAFEYLDESNREIGEYLAEDPYASVALEDNWYQFSGFIGSASEFFPAALGEVLGFVGQKWSLYSFIDIFKPTTFAYFFYFLTLERLQGVGQLAVMVIVTFVLEIIITITGYRAFAAALGGELEILGLTKVI